MSTVLSTPPWDVAEVPWLVHPRAEEAEGRPHGGLQLPHEGSGGAGAELCSLGTETGPKGMA